MSWEATNHVWSRRHPYSGYKVVLLCIADMLPSIHGRGATWAVDFQTISCRTDLSLRVVKEVVWQLEQDGEIEVIRGKRGQPNTYRYLYRDVVGQGAAHSMRGAHVRTGKRKIENSAAVVPDGLSNTVPDGKGVVDSTIDGVVGSTRDGAVDSTSDGAVDSTRAAVVHSFPLAVVETEEPAVPAQGAMTLLASEEGGAEEELARLECERILRRRSAT